MLTEALGSTYKRKQSEVESDDEPDEGQKNWLSDDLDDSIETDFTDPDCEENYNIFMEHEDDEQSSEEDEEDADDLTEDNVGDKGLMDIDSNEDSAGCEDLMDVDEYDQVEQ